MEKNFTPTGLKKFFSEIYWILKDTDKKVLEIWYETSEIRFFRKFNKSELREFIDKFEFITIKRGSYTNFIAINKILFIIESSKYLDFDLHKFSDLVDFDGFEALILEILKQNGYRATKNFRFSDKSNFKLNTKQKRYEVDVIGIYDSFILMIDAKQWKRKDVYGATSKAANLQLQRAVALEKNPEAVSTLIHQLLGYSHKLRLKLPLLLIPLICTLEDNWIKFNENFIPLVSIYSLNAFLQELRANLSYFNKIEIRKVLIQQPLL